MEQFEPDRLSAAQLAAMRRSLTSGRGALTRRSLLRASGVGALTLGGLSTLAACGIPPAKRAGDAAAASDDHSAQEKEINFSNWTEYMDTSEDEKSRPTLEEFTKRTGIKVKYTEDINDNVEFFGKIRPQLAAGQDTGRDLIVVTDWLASRIIRLGWAQKLDPSHLPHAYANLIPQFRTPDWDPGRSYSYPWTGIDTVIAYNTKATDGKKVDSVTQLLDDPTLKGRVGFLTEMRDSVGMTLLDQGKDPANFTTADFDGAIEQAPEGRGHQADTPLHRQRLHRRPRQGRPGRLPRLGGRRHPAPGRNPDIQYAIPAPGYITSSDNLLVPAHARHKANAEKLIDFYYEPEVAAQLAAFISYVCPVEGVKDELAKIDPALADNPLIVPDKAMAAKAHSFRSLSSEEETAYEEKFAKLIGA